MACPPGTCPDCDELLANPPDVKIRGNGYASYFKMHPCDVLALTPAVIPAAPITFAQQYAVGLAVLPVVSPLKTITLSVIAGTVTVAVNSGTGFIAPAGSTWTWGNDDFDGLDITGMSFTGDASADFVLHGEK